MENENSLIKIFEDKNIRVQVLVPTIPVQYLLIV